MKELRRLSRPAKKALCLFLVLVTVVGFLPVSIWTPTVQAEEGDYLEDIDPSMFDGTGKPIIPDHITLTDAGMNLSPDGSRWITESKYHDTVLDTDCMVHFFKVQVGTISGGKGSSVSAYTSGSYTVGLCGDHTKHLDPKNEGDTWSNPQELETNPYLVYFYTMYYNTVGYYSKGTAATLSHNGVEYKIWNTTDFKQEMAAAQAITWGILNRKIPSEDSDHAGYVEKCATMRADALNAIWNTMGINKQTTVAAEKAVVEQIITNYKAGAYQKILMVEYKTYDGSHNKRSTQPVIVGLPYKLTYEPHNYYGEIAIKKEDSAGQPLAGAKFGIFWDSECQHPVTTEGGDGRCDGATIYAGNTMETKVTGNELTDGWAIGWSFLIPSDSDQKPDKVKVYVKELEAPDGYTLLEDVIEYELTTEDIGDTNFNGQIVWPKDATGKPISLINGDPYYFYVKLEKVNENGVALGGAQFSIYSNEECTQSVGSFTTTEDGDHIYGPFLYPDPDPGVLYLRETSAPSGYRPSTDKYTFTVTGEQKKEAKYKDDDSDPVIIPGQVKNLPGEPTHTPSNGGPITPGLLRKIDARTGLGIGPATFKFSSGNHSYDIQVNAKGEGSFQWQDPLQDSYIEPGTYYVTETQPPAGYERTDEGKWVTLTFDEDGNPVCEGTLIFANNKLHSVKIQKRSADNTPLAGAVFNVYKDGTLIASEVTTGADGNIVFDGADHKGLSSGYYEFEEVTPPDGYLLPEDNRFGVYVDATDTTYLEHVFTVTNYKYPDIVIEKKDKGSGTGLSGAKFEVYLDAQLLGEYTTNEEGKIVLDYATYGKFLTEGKESWTVGVREVAPPSGYMIDDTGLHELQLKKGEKLATFEFEDTQYPGITILKLDAATNEPLAGADFEVVVNGHSLGTKTTDGEGKILIDYETYGSYLGDAANYTTVEVREVKAPAGYILVDKDWQSQYMVPGQTSATFTFRDPKYPTIKIKKTDAEDGTPLEGAGFEVRIDDTPIGGGTLYTDHDGYITLDYETYQDFLTEGRVSWTVSVREVKPPDGYLLDDPDWQSQELSAASGVVEFAFTDTKYPEIHIVKWDYSHETNLPGAEFEVRIDGESLGTFTTDKHGKIDITYEDYRRFLEEHNYSGWTVQVRETKAPDGYVITDDTWHTVELKRGESQVTFEFRDSTYPVIRILKLAAGTNTPLAGAKFEISIDGELIKNGPFVTDESGVIEIDYETYNEFLKRGETHWTVTVREVEPPDGYLLDDPVVQQAELYLENGFATFVFNDTKYPDIEILKRDKDTNALLPGAEFEIMIDGVIFGIRTTNDEGLIQITYDEYKRFLDEHHMGDGDSWTVAVREVTAPGGYYVSDDTWHIGELRYGQGKLTFEFKDSKYPTILIKKEENGTLKGLAGAVFEVRIDDTTIPGTFTTDADGYIRLDYETYKEFLSTWEDSWTVSVREVSPPDGYLLDDPGWHEAELQLGQSLASFVFTDTKYPEIHIEKWDYNHETPLAGAEFEVQIDGESLGRFSTGEDGKVHITYEQYRRFLEEHNYSGWTVQVRETKAPGGYVIVDDTWHTVELKRGQSEVTFEFRDSKYPVIRILKLEDGTNKPLAGAKFDVSIDGETLANSSFVTDENGVIEIDYETYNEFLGQGKTHWTVTVREVEPPDGYMLDDPTVQQAELYLENGLATFVFTDTKYPEIEIIKRDRDSNALLPGAEFEIMIDGVVFGTRTTDDNGRIVVTYDEYKRFLDEHHMGDGDSWTVAVREVTAPGGYLIEDDTWHSAELRFGQGKVTFEFEDSKYPTILIKKTDNGTGTGLEGAVFEVRIDDTTIPGSFVTDKDGYIKIDYENFKNYLTEGKDSWTVSVREVSPPDGYLLDDPSWHESELRLGQSLASFVFTDTQYPDILIIKRDRETGEVLPNTTFHILIDGKEFGTRTTDEEGKILITYDEYRRFLDEDNFDNWTVSVTETEAPDKYNLDNQEASGTRTLTHQLKTGQKRVVFEFNDTSFRSIKVYKHDSLDSRALAGAVFRLHCVSADDQDPGHIADRELTTGEEGFVVFEDLPNGTYELTEIIPPVGYHGTDEVITVVVTSDSDPVLEYSFRNIPMSGLIIQKIDSLTKQPIEGVEFLITPLAPLTDAPITATTDENGQIILEYLKPGTYRVQEQATVDGYTLNTEVRDVVITDKHEKTLVVFENDQKGMLNIFKVDSLTGKGLPGAEFEITTESGEHVAHAVTGPNGYASVPGLDSGAYVVYETKAPDGYVLDSTPYSVDVKVGENKTLTVENVPDGVLHITKIDAETREPIPGVVFEVYSGQVGSGAFTVLGQYVTDEHGIATTEPLKPGTYTVREISVPGEYLIDESYHDVVVRAGEYNNIVIENMKAATLIVRKIDSKTGKPIPGAVFKVESADRMDLVGTLESDANGEAIFSGLKEGAYIVTETQAPAGYELSDPSEKTIYVEAGKRNYCDFVNVAHGSLVIVLREKGTGKELYGGEFRVTRESDQVVVYDGSTDTTGTIVVGDLVPGWYFVEQIYAPDGYTMVDKELHVEVLPGEEQRVYFEDVTAGILIEKYDSNDPSIMLEGARFQVKRDSDGIVIGEYVTGKDGKVQVGELVPGLYTVTELVAPDGYSIDEGPKTVEVKEGTVAHVAFKDTAFGGITVEVVDAATQKGVPGAIVEVWRQNGNLINTYTTDTTGTFMTGKLPDGFYVLKLTHVPDGYTADVMEATVEIRNGASVTYKFELTKKASLKIVSESSYGQAVAGVTFTLTKPDGAVIGTYITGPDGSVIVNGLEPGVYVIKPVKAPDGYSFSSTESVNVQLKAGELAVSKFVMQVMTSIKIRFVDGVTGNPIYGIRLQVRDTGPTGTIREFFSDNDGCVTLDNSFLTGTYVIEMLGAPAGYIVDTTPKSIETLAASTTMVTWKVYPEGGQIQVLLTSADYNATLNLPAGTALQGAVFEITNADTYQVMGRIMTDARGVAASAALPVGRYIVKQVAAAPYYHMSTATSELRIKLNNDIVQTAFTNKSVNLKTSVSMQSNGTIKAGNSMRVDILTAANNSDVELDNFFVHIKVPTDAARASTFSTGTWNTAVTYKISVKTNMRDYYTLASDLLSTNMYNYDLSSQALGLQSGEYVTDVRMEYGTVPAGFALKTKMAFMEYVLATVYDQYKLINRVEVGGQHNTVSLSTNPANPEFTYSGEAGMGAVSGNSGAWATAVGLWTSTVKSTVKTPGTLPKTGY